MTTKTSSSSTPELFPQLTPPPGGLARLRDALDDGPRRRRRPAPWRVAVGVAVAVALVVVVLARGGGAGAGGGVDVFGVVEQSGGARVEVDGQVLSMQTLPSSTVLVWLPPSS